MKRMILIALTASILASGTAFAAGCDTPTGAEGMLRYSSSNKKLYFCNGTAWIEVGATTNTPTSVVGQASDNRMYSMPFVGANGGTTVTLCTGPVGSTCGGGYYAGDGNLVVAPGGCGGTAASPSCPALPGSADGGSTYNWKNSVDDSNVGNNHRYGFGATEAAGNSNHPALFYCKNLVYGGYSDWYLPTAYELSVLYNSRQELGNFSSSTYWSSSEIPGGKAWFYYMDKGASEPTNKNNAMRVRCVRRN